MANTSGRSPRVGRAVRSDPLADLCRLAPEDRTLASSAEDAAERLGGCLGLGLLEREVQRGAVGELLAVDGRDSPVIKYGEGEVSWNNTSDQVEIDERLPGCRNSSVGQVIGHTAKDPIVAVARDP